MQYFLLAVGLAMVVASAERLIDSTSKIAKRLGVSTFVIGITVIAFGTSAPELAVGILSGISHTNQLTLGNIIGSGVSNVALIVGISAIIMPLVVKDNVIKREIPILIGVEAVLSALLFLDGKLSRIDGAILVAGFAGFMAYIALSAKKSEAIQIDAQGDIDTDGDGNNVPAQAAANEKAVNPKSQMLKLWLIAALSLAGLFIGGRLTVDASTDIAASLGLEQTLIGLTVVAFATTLPELIASVIAAIKKEPEIVLGNCIGSNIFNILLVLGSSSLISPIMAEGALWIDAVILFALTLLVFTVAIVRKSVRRSAGVFLLLSYVGYIVFKVLSAVIG